MNQADTFENYAITDAALVSNIQNGDDTSFPALLSRYFSMIRIKASQYSSTTTIDPDDFVQEGLLALYRAACAYKQTSSASFKTFTNAVVDNSMIDLIRKNKRATSKTSNIPIDNILENIENPNLHSISAQDEYEQLETIQAFFLKANSVLSDFEQKVLFYRIEGLSYKEIADILNSKVKTIDNTLQSIRRKLQ